MLAHVGTRGIYYLFDQGLHGLSWLCRLNPAWQPSHLGIEVTRDVPYQESGLPAHTLDVYRPTRAKGPRPVVLYIHGGSFSVLSKDTHWPLSVLFARHGYVVFNINYRLAPRHPFPAALLDCAAAYRFVAARARDFGGDPARLVLSGESAGANLATALTLASSYAAPALPGLPLPAAVVAACGVLQVSDLGRLRRAHPRSPLLIGLDAALEGYLPAGGATSGTGALRDLLELRALRALADPLLLLERGAPPTHPLPPFFVPVGGKDPLLDDSRRLKAALDRLGARCELRCYDGQAHAFHALLFRDAAQRCWRDTFAFLDAHL